MGYSLHAFICNTSDADALITRFDQAAKIDIGQELTLIPMTEELFDQINNFKLSASINSFKYLTKNVEQVVLRVFHNKLAYIEADYFGGSGGQIGIIWNKGKRENILEFGPNNINQVVKEFGVKASRGHDEFSTLNLGRNTETGDWLENTD